MEDEQNTKNNEENKFIKTQTLLKPFIKLSTEKFSTFSHLFGGILFIVGTFLLSIRTQGDAMKYAVCRIYGISNVFLFFSSALTHSQRTIEDGRTFWTIFDHIGIFILIAGTYTAIVYYYLEGAWRIGIVIAQWSFAVIGSIISLFDKKAPKWSIALIYLIQGWMVLLFIGQLHSTMSSMDFTLILIAGLSYTIGTIFYAKKKKNNKNFLGILKSHDIWHIFVLVGAILFYIVVWNAI
jgi:hemolysin III